MERREKYERRWFNGDTDRTVIIEVSAECPSNKLYICAWEWKALHCNFTLLGSMYSAVYQHQWSHFNLGWKACGNYYSGTFSIDGRAAWKWAVWAAVGCKMNHKKPPSLLCFPYKWSRDESYAIIKHCLVVPTNLSVGHYRLSLFSIQRKELCFACLVVFLMTYYDLAEGQVLRDAECWVLCTSMDWTSLFL